MTLEWTGPIEFIGLGPITPAGCGTRYEETVIRPKNCCEDATPIIWDYDNSVSVLTDYTSGLVFVTGGVSPYHWKIRGVGMTFDNYSLRDADTDEPWIRIYAGDACGYCPVEVTDGCSVANVGIKSTNGQWIQTYLNTTWGIDICPLMGHCSSDIVQLPGGVHFIAERNGIKIDQIKTPVFWAGGSFPSAAAAEASCWERYEMVQAYSRDVRCGPDPSRCVTCFAGDAYTPCQQLSGVPNYDPNWQTSCNINVFAYYGLQDVGWGARAHDTYISYTVVEQWRC